MVSEKCCNQVLQPNINFLLSFDHMDIFIFAIFSNVAVKLVIKLLTTGLRKNLNITYGITINNCYLTIQSCQCYINLLKFAQTRDITFIIFDKL